MFRFRVQMEFGPKQIGEATQVLKALVGPVRSEPGCTATSLLTDPDNDRSLIFLGEWRRREDFVRHLARPTFRRILAVIDLASREPVIDVDQIASRRGFGVIEELLGMRPEAGKMGALPAD